MLQTIKQKAQGSAVKAAQYLTGYAGRENASGNFDANYVAHVCAWQRNHNLTPDGIIGPKTWTAIAKAAPTCSTAKNRTSAATCALQILIGGLTADGIFGPKTKAAVAAYQAAKGMTADGITGPKTWAALIVGAAEAAPAGSAAGFKQPVDYKQYDSRWGKAVYTSCGNKSQTISNSGCGPSAMADIVATLKDSAATPKTLAALAVKWGDRTKSSGTAWTFFRHIQTQYGFSKMIQTTSMSTLKACLDAGGYAVCSMGPGYWTKGGHFICAWKYDSAYIYCNDPASNSRKKQKITQFERERKQYFCFYK